MMASGTRLNFKHLRYFAAVARHGSVSGAARALHVAPQTVSAQLLELEDALGQPLFERGGGRLALTTAGETALDYATSIFALGDELAAVLRGELRPRNLALRVGVTDSVPKLLTLRILEPVIRSHGTGLELDCSEGPYPDLLGRLAASELDVVIADAPMPPGMAKSLHATVLGESGTSLLATRPLARRLARGFPASLDRAPWVAGAAHGGILGTAMEAWFARLGVRPQVAARVEDSALLKLFAQRGMGVIAVPTVVEEETMRLHGLALVGRTDEVRQAVYLLRTRRRRAHPLVAAMEAAGLAKPRQTG